MSKYKITVNTDGLGYKIILWKKFIFFYLPDTFTRIYDFDYAEKARHIKTWQREFNIPDSAIIIKK